MGKGGGLGQRGALLAASMKVLVEVLESLFPSHAISSFALAACVGFTPGHVAVWESGLGVPPSCRAGSADLACAPQTVAQKHLISSHCHLVITWLPLTPLC